MIIVVDVDDVDRMEEKYGKLLSENKILQKSQQIFQSDKHNL